MASPAIGKEKILLLNEGTWQSDNGKLTYFEDGAVVSNQWFRDVNGTKLGDTPNDIIQVNSNLIAIAVNWSNIVQFITPEGKAVAATEAVPNNRKMATDGKYVYVSSYGHECGTVGGTVEFTKGFVAKIDVATFKVVAAVEVGYEPEGITLYKGKLFVANTGGYSFSESHDYESTVSVVDAATMKVERTVDTGQINLCGKLSRSGQYLLVSSPGDYYEVAAATIVMDCQAVIDGKADSECFQKLNLAATYSCVAADGNFYAIGSTYSYVTSNYEFSYAVVNPAEAISSKGSSGVDSSLPGTVVDDIKKMQSPYDIYVNPYTGYIYATDAESYAEAGKLYQWSAEGKLLGSHKVYINPAHFLALPPDGVFPDVDAITEIASDASSGDGAVYNLQGMRVANLVDGRIYIKNGRKFLYKNR